MLFDGVNNYINEPSKKLYENLKERLIKYYRENNRLAYGYPDIGNVRIAFITGQGDERDSFASFSAPIPFKTVTGKYILFVDVRIYTRKKIDGLNDIDDIILNKTGFDALMTYAVLYAKHLNGESMSAAYLEETVSILSTVISSHIGQSMRANINDTEDFKILLAYYFSHLLGLYEKREQHMIFAAKTTVAVRNISKVQELIGDYDGEIKDTNGFISLIENTISGTRLSNIDRTSFIVSATSMVFGDYLRKQMSMSLEDPAMFTPVFYTVLKNRLFSKTQLFGILKQQKRLNIDDHMKTIEKCVELDSDY
jgi:hypothetical protein